MSSPGSSSVSLWDSPDACRAAASSPRLHPASATRAEAAAQYGLLTRRHLIRSVIVARDRPDEADPNDRLAADQFARRT